MRSSAEADPTAAGPAAIARGAPDRAGDDRPLLREGDTCWAIARAERFAVIIDAADYFKAVKAAALKARSSIMLIAWDFDTRIKLEPLTKTLPGPNRLGRFLNWLVRHNKRLQVYVLKWDFGVVNALGRGTTPLFILDWLSDRRVHFKLDSVHPLGASHHQKIIAIDDAIAFAGGIDLTFGRWDTRAHRDDEPGRRGVFGRRQYKPWHDATTVLTGPAAARVGELARARWLKATDQTIDPPTTAGHDYWPEDIKAAITDVDVAIARTLPGAGSGDREVHEIEALDLECIRRARTCLYLESQYFASRSLVEAIAARLEEPDGPEVVVINPRDADGWIEQEAMDTARARLMRLCKEADRHDRFRILCPKTEEGQPIYVHAKIAVVDDRVLKVGSSNLNNRSLGLDTECDIAVEALPGSPREAEIAAAIRRVRLSLVAEHLGVEPAQLEAELATSCGSLVGAIDALRAKPGRTLHPVPERRLGPIEKAVAESPAIDPEHPDQMRIRWKRWGRALRKKFSPF